MGAGRLECKWVWLFLFQDPQSLLLWSGAVYGFKNNKSWLSCLACCSSNGTEKMLVMIIGHPKIKSISRKNNEKTWVWLLLKKQGMDDYKAFQLLVGRDWRFHWPYNGTQDGTLGRQLFGVWKWWKFAILIKYSPWVYSFLPSNTASKVQPMDAGIIGYLKSKFCRTHLFQNFDNIKASKNSI